GVLDPSVASIDRRGVVRPLQDGHTEIAISHNSRSMTLPVHVRRISNPIPVSFEQEVIPVLTKATCNSGGCHGKAEGQNGFKLSVFGFDPLADYTAITKEARGRRVFPAAPESSLLLLKATGRVPHGGGKKIDDGSLRYRRLARWIAEGADYGRGDAPPIVAVEVEPALRTLALKGTQQIRVTVIDGAGNRRCVTAEAEYESNAPSIAV